MSMAWSDHAQSSTAVDRTARVKLRELVECPICLDVVEEPKMLPCLHTYCLDCIDQLLRQSAVPPDSHWDHHQAMGTDLPRRLCCPLCRSPVDVRGTAAALPTNYVVSHVVDVYRAIEAGDGTASRRESPSRPPIGNDDGDRCEQHPTQQLVLYCSEPGCSTPICASCLVLDHRTHDCSTMADVAASLRARLYDVTETVERRLADVRSSTDVVCRRRKLTDVDARRAVADVGRRAAELHRAVDAAKDELIQQVDRRRRERLEQLDDCVGRLSADIADLEELRQTCGWLKDGGSDVDVVRMWRVLMGKTDVLMKQSNNVEVLPDDFSISLTSTPEWTSTASEPEMRDALLSMFGSLSCAERSDNEEEATSKTTSRGEVQMSSDAKMASTTKAIGIADKLPEKPDVSARSDQTRLNESRTAGVNHVGRSRSTNVDEDRRHAVVVHGFYATGPHIAVDQFLEFCRQHVGYTPAVVRSGCRYLGGRRALRSGNVVKAPLLVVCETGSDVERLVDEAQRRIIRARTGISFTKYKPDDVLTKVH